MAASNVVKIQVENKNRASLKMLIKYANANGELLSAWGGAGRHVSGHVPGKERYVQEFTATLENADTTRSYSVEMYVGDSTAPIFVESYAFGSTNLEKIRVNQYDWTYVVGIVFACTILVLLIGLFVFRAYPFVRSLMASRSKSSSGAGSAPPKASVGPISTGNSGSYDTVIFAPESYI